MYFKIRYNDCKNEKVFQEYCRHILYKHNADLWVEYLDRARYFCYPRHIDKTYGWVCISKAIGGHYIEYIQDEHGIRRHIIYKWDRRKNSGYFFLYDCELADN